MLRIDGGLEVFSNGEGLDAKTGGDGVLPTILGDERGAVLERDGDEDHVAALEVDDLVAEAGEEVVADKGLVDGEEDHGEWQALFEFTQFEGSAEASFFGEDGAVVFGEPVGGNDRQRVLGAEFPGELQRRCVLGTVGEVHVHEDAGVDHVSAGKGFVHGPCWRRPGGGGQRPRLDLGSESILVGEMKRHFSSFGQVTIAEAQLDETQINGLGGVAAPILSMPLAIAITYGQMQPREGVQLRQVRAKLTAVATGHAVMSTSVELNRLIVPKFSTTTETAYLEFPLDRVLLAELERIRNGGDLGLRLDATLVADQMLLLNPQRTELDGYAWAFSAQHTMWAQMEVTIPRDGWIKKVLPNAGFGSVHVLEFPAAPLEACAALGHSYAALAQAMERHRVGLYDDAVGKCRVALDPFFEYVDADDGKGGKKKVPKLKSSWETRLGQATYRWLNDALGALKLAANPNHHSPNPHFDQLESQMVIAVTTALVAYAARVSGETK